MRSASRDQNVRRRPAPLVGDWRTSGHRAAARVERSPAATRPFVLQPGVNEGHDDPLTQVMHRTSRVLAFGACVLATACGTLQSSSGLSAPAPTTEAVPSATTAGPAPASPSPNAVTASPAPTVAPAPALRSVDHVTSSPRPSPTPRTAPPLTASPTITILPVPPTTRPGATWTPIPNPMIPPGTNGCVPQTPGSIGTRDCVARGLPPGAKVTLTTSGAGGSYLVTWLADVDANGNVPFPWDQQQPGTTVFTVAAGGVVVRFDTTFP
jgi:hypothetical protein